MKKRKEHKQMQAGKNDPSAIITDPDLERWKYYGLLAVILIISFIAYIPVLHNSSFVWDDDGYISNNLLIKTFSLKEIFSRNVMGNYHPLTIMVLAIECHFFGFNAAGYHAVNLFLHLLNVILVFYAVSLLCDKTMVALVAALLFGIHPMHVESVAWASGLKDVLYAFFFLASYIFYLKYLIRLNKKFYVFSLMLFSLSLLSKAMAASLPFILLLTDYYKGRKIEKTALLEKVPFLVLSVTFGVIAVFAQKTSGNISDLAFNVPQRLAFACYGFITYLIKLVLPLNLSAFYPYPVKNADAFPMIYYAYVLFIVGLVVLVFYSLRFSKKILFGLGFFAVTVFLVLQLLPVGKAIMADRYSYIPSIGVFFLAGEGFCLLWGKKLKLMTILLLSAFTVFFSVKTYARCGIWKNETTLWNDVISQYEKVPFAYLNRGIAYAKENQYDKAIEDISKAIQLDTNYTKAYYNNAKAYYNRGNLYMNERKFEMALKDFDKSIELNPEYTQAYYNRGNIYADMQDYDKALADYSKAIELNPEGAKAYINRGYVSGIKKEYESATKDIDKAIELNPNDAEAYYNRGILFMNMEKYDRAIEAFDKAIDLNPNDAEAYLNRGYVYSLAKRYNEAISNFSKAIELKSGDGRAFYNRGLAKYYSGNKEAAYNDLKQAASLGYKLAEDLLSTMSGSE
jgi:protein O-mannosyl-transferase